VVRLGLGHTDMLVRGLGALMNAVALGFFAATIAASAIAWRQLNHPKSRRKAT